MTNPSHPPSDTPPSPDTTQGDPAAASEGMLMPGDDEGAASPGGSDPPVPAKATPFGLQMAQLVIIPAVIVVVCILLAVMFGLVAGAQDSIDTHLMKLRQSGGSGRLAMGLQDPRYKDRGLAAYNIATMIPRIDDPAEKQRVSDELIEILDDHVGDQEQVLQAYLLLALGQLGQPGGLSRIVKAAAVDHPQVRQGAVGGLLSWPDRAEARAMGLEMLIRLLDDEAPVVIATAAAALGELATPHDLEVIAGLKRALEGSVGLEGREARWNAAVTLAKLGDAAGGQFVAAVLLDRESLGKMPAGESGPSAQETMTRAGADRIILATLASLRSCENPIVWDKIAQIADNDPSRAVRSAAKQLVMGRQRSQNNTGSRSASEAGRE